LQLVRSNRPLPVSFERSRVAEIICYLLFNLLGGHHLIERWLRLRILFRPNAVPPVNFFKRSLITCALCERQRSLGTRYWRFGTGESQQRSTYHRTRCGLTNKER